MNKKEFEAEKRRIDTMIVNLRKEKEELKERYCQEVFEKSGYHIGDTVEVNGRKGVVVGVEMFVYPRLKVSPLKKDGTPSKKIDFSMGIELNEDYGNRT